MKIGFKDKEEASDGKRFRCRSRVWLVRQFGRHGRKVERGERLSRR